MTVSTHQFAVSLFILFFLFQILTGSHSAIFTIVNRCSYTVWPGILSGAGTPPLSTTGFVLRPGKSNTVVSPAAWSGSLWGRTLCSQDSTTRNFSCVTGDCGSSTVECAGRGVAAPATLVEFTLNGASGLDFFDVSLVNGYNLPLTVAPRGGTGAGNCSATGCLVDLNAACPAELKMTSSGGVGVACKSACQAFGDPQYCCSGAYGTPHTCKPSNYSQLFKTACPHAYTYEFDQATTNFTCASADYLVTFCPTSTVWLKPLPKNVKNSTVVDNAGGHADGSANNIIAFAVALALFCLALASKLTGCWKRLACHIQLEAATSSEATGPQSPTV